MKKLTFLCGAGLLVVSSAFLFGYKAENTRHQVARLPAVATGFAADTGISRIVRLAEAFKATLKEDQLSLLQLNYSKQDAARWSNFPQAFSRPNRVGVGLGQLTQPQLAAAKALMGQVLARDQANEGYDELEGILAADDYFGKTTGKATVFGSANFYIAFLGNPSATALWELQFGGHHLAVSNTYNKGKLTGVTPSFRGVEPMASVTANSKTYQPVEQERTAFSQLIESLTGAQKETARLSNTYSDLLLGPGADGKFPATRQGVKAGELNSAQQKQVVKAIGLYVDDLDPATARSIMAKYTAELANTYVSYAGSGTMNQTNDYVRIDGPGVWIEYSVQPSRDIPNTTHPHSVWRDRASDYGGN